MTLPVVLLLCLEHNMLLIGIISTFFAVGEKRTHMYTHTHYSTFRRSLDANCFTKLCCYSMNSSLNGAPRDMYDFNSFMLKMSDFSSLKDCEDSYCCVLPVNQAHADGSLLLRCYHCVHSFHSVVCPFE